MLLFLMFFYKMFKTLCHYRAHMVVGKEVVYRFSLPAVCHEVCVFQHLELVRNSRLRHSQKLRYSANAHFAFEKRIEDLHSRCVAENLEKVGKVADKLILGKLAFDLF